MMAHKDFMVHVSEPTNSEILSHPTQDITYYYGRYQCPLKTSLRNSLWVANYHSIGFHELEPLAAPVRRLTFLHVGSEEPANVSAYARSCTWLEFTGHISSTNAVLGIVEQLPKLEELSISIGHLQGVYEPDDWRAPTVCPSVIKLKIQIDMKYYNRFQHVDCDKKKDRTADCFADKCMSLLQNSMAELAKSLLIHAMGSFPNLKYLDVDLLDNGFLDQIVNSLIENSPKLKNLVREAEAGEARPRVVQNPIGAEGTRVRPQIYH